MKWICFCLFLAVSLLDASIMEARQLPCFLHQVDRSIDSQATVAVIGILSGTGGCQYDLVAHQVAIILQYQLQEKDPNGEWVTRRYFNSIYRPIGERNRQRLLVSNLQDGECRLITANAGNFLEALHFSAGGTADLNNLDLSVPYAQSAGVAHNGYLYFRAHLGRGTVARGHLYQGNEIMEVEFVMVEPEDHNLIINLPWVRGGIFDLPWVRAKLRNGNGSFDPS